MREQMKLKQVYVETMSRLWPEWVEELSKRERRLQRHFRIVVDTCDSELWEMITKWLNQNENLYGTDEYRSRSILVVNN
jgi:hypothetical protein